MLNWFMIVFFLTVNLDRYIISQTLPTPTEPYPFNVTLLYDPPNEIHLFWKHTNQTITFELHLKRSRWVVFGVKNYFISDVVLAWLDIDGVGHFSSRVLTNLNDFYVNPRQNYMPLDVFRKADISVFKFERPIKLVCDCNESVYLNLDILSGENKVVYWHGSEIDLFNQTINTPFLAFRSMKLLNESLGPFNCINANARSLFNSTPTGFYLNQADLALNGDYKFFWNLTNSELIGEVHCRTNGWVGFGFSSQRNKTNGDLFIGWVDSQNRVNFTDRYLNATSNLLIDKSQDWRLLFATQRDGYTIFKFSRPLRLCEPEDLALQVNACLN
jgi:hypothetical protein